MSFWTSGHSDFRERGVYSLETWPWLSVLSRRPANTKVTRADMLDGRCSNLATRLRILGCFAAFPNFACLSDKILLTDTPFEKPATRGDEVMIASETLIASTLFLGAMNRLIGQ